MSTQDEVIPPELTTQELVEQKLDLAHNVPGLQVALDPDEADLAGAFLENALTEHDAADSTDGPVQEESTFRTILANVG